MPRILVVDYSFTGITAEAANTLAAQLGADQIHIDYASPRSGLIDVVRALWEVFRKRCPEIRTTGHQPESYDLVVLASPVWAGNISSPMRSYAVANRSRLRRVAFLCTQGSSGAENAFDGLTDLLGQVPLAELSISKADLASGADASKIAAFAKLLLAELSTPADAAETEKGARAGAL